MVFLPREPASRTACEQEIVRAIQAEGQILLGWRDVPTDNSTLGESVKPTEPSVLLWNVVKMIPDPRPTCSCAD